MRRNAWTLVEVIVVISIIAVLAALSYPVFVAVKAKANETTCMSNLHQLQMAVALYREDYGSGTAGTPEQMGLPPNSVVLRH
ncbi:MAG: prepilin-type N-terminal cleavage/methylation domain-containing protein [Fimbriimonadaceae bacterium]|nr:prepilin-type N-terminal cleavage/methylation domain-containing protein [Fimbriimonadaceae bacterium]